MYTSKIAGNIEMDMCKYVPGYLVEGSSFDLSTKALITPLSTRRKKNVNLRHHSRSPKLE
jgi:hypothetical protein